MTEQELHIETVQNQNAKSDAGKPRLTLVPPSLIWAVAAVWRRFRTHTLNLSILALNNRGEWIGEIGYPYGEVIAWIPLPRLNDLPRNKGDD